MEFKANSGVWGTMFGVPCIVADNFLKLADESQIKVLLYLLRYSGKSVTSEEISLNTGISVEQANDAVMFWQQVNVLSQDMTVVTSSDVATEKHSSTSKNYNIEQSQKNAKSNELITENTISSANESNNIINTSPQSRKPYIYPSEISSIIRDNNNIAELFTIAESLLGSLNPAMQNSLIWMHNYLGLKKEVILILIGYCVDIDKTNPSYIDKIAASWVEKGINSLEIATAEVEKLNNAHSYTNEIKKIFELQQNPTPGQIKYINQWEAEGFSTDLLRCAYEKTVEQINKVSFPYINSILLSWQKNGIKTSDDVKNEESKKKRNVNTQSSDGFNPDNYKIVINNI